MKNIWSSAQNERGKKGKVFNTYTYLYFIELKLIHFYTLLLFSCKLFLYQLSGKQTSCYSLLPPLWQVTVFDTFVTKRMCQNTDL